VGRGRSKRSPDGEWRFACRNGALSVPLAAASPSA